MKRLWLGIFPALLLCGFVTGSDCLAKIDLSRKSTGV